jgi:aminoglycoside N3'-acetyltransferase
MRLQFVSKQSTRRELTRAEVVAQLEALGVDRGGVLLVHDENDHCCARFAFADDWLRARGLQAEGRVGYAHSRLARSRDIVRVAVEELAGDPLMFLHPASAGCADCDEARASVRGA